MMSEGNIFQDPHASIRLYLTHLFNHSKPAFIIHHFPPWRDSIVNIKKGLCIQRPLYKIHLLWLLLLRCRLHQSQLGFQAQGGVRHGT